MNADAIAELPSFSEFKPTSGTLEAWLASQKRQRYWTVATVFIVGAVSLGLIYWTDQIRQRQRSEFALHDTLSHLRSSVLTSHLMLDESVRDETLAGMTATWSAVNKARTVAALLLKGGISSFGASLEPVTDPELRQTAEQIIALLAEFTTASREFYQYRHDLDMSRALNQRCDEISENLIVKIDRLENLTEARTRANHAQASSLMFWIFTFWILLVSAATTAVMRWERARKELNELMRRTNDDLEEKVAERTYALRALTDVIEARTISLSDANSALQKEVSERKETELALRESEERHRSLVETMNEGLMVIDRNCAFTYVNEKFCQMLGYSRQELLGRRYEEFLADSEKHVISANLCRDICRDSSDTAETKQVPTEIAFTNKCGERIITIVSPKEEYDADNNLVSVFAVITDITEKIALQAATIRASHLVSLGEVAAGVAHEINNPLNGIINYGQILLDQSGADSFKKDLCNRIVKEGRRIGDIVRALLIFAHGGAKEKRLIAVPEILSYTLELMGSELRHEGILVEINCASDLPPIQADPQEIQQVFMNLISNARYALNQRYPTSENHKRLAITVEHSSGNGSVRISFLDFGIGIARENIDKIRDPFFSTKPRGQGTGLGLSISDGIIRDHRGQLTIDSVVNEYTKISIDFPAA